MQNIKEQLWKISLSMASIYGADRDFEIFDDYKGFWKKVEKGRIEATEFILFGIAKTTSKLVFINNIERVNSFLDKEFGIKSKRDLAERLDEIFDGSKARKSFDEKRKVFVSLPYIERLSLTDRNKYGEVDAYQYEIIYNYESLLPKAGILAFDIANYISICRLGAFIGYIKVDELIRRADEAAVLIRKSYSSFQEFGYASMVGLLFDAEKIEYKKYKCYFERLKKILRHKDSYWRNLEWDMNFENQRRFHRFISG